MLTTKAANRKDTATASGGVRLEHRHFCFIAATIAAMDGCASYRAEIAKDFANAGAGTNPKFDRERFLAACRAAE